MKITVPEDIGGKLKILPETQLNARIQDVYLGKSKNENPKATVKWVITEECTDKKAMKEAQKHNEIETTVGENVLETFSLLENAIWNLNDLFMQVTHDRIPQGDYDETGFGEMLKSQLIGGEARLDLKYDSSLKRTIVNDRA